VSHSAQQHRHGQHGADDQPSPLGTLLGSTLGVVRLVGRPGRRARLGQLVPGRGDRGA
jgi:hypothetical protein